MTLLTFLLVSGGVLAYALPDTSTPTASAIEPNKTKGAAIRTSKDSMASGIPPANSLSGVSVSSAAISTNAAAPQTKASRPTQPIQPTKPADTFQINEQFSGSSLNNSLWQAMTRAKGYRNNEEQDYLPSQVAVSNGTLQITAHRDASGNWHSGEVNSKWNYTYGEFEVRLALSTTGPGVWPAAWLLGVTDTWPNGGELDMFENINGDNRVYGTLHGGGDTGAWQLQKQATGSNVTQYHTYKIIKQPNSISWWIDGVRQALWTPTQVPGGGVWPFESHANIGILSLAIGGAWPGPSNAGTPSTITMYVDYFTAKNAT